MSDSTEALKTDYTSRQKVEEDFLRGISTDLGQCWDISRVT